METLDHDHEIYTTPNKADESLLVKFYMDSREDVQATQREGRPIFKEVEIIDIRIPGNRDNIVIRPIRKEDIERFPRHYKLFKERVAGAEDSPVGTPLSLWSYLRAPQIKEFEYFNVKTVEQLVAMPDSVGSKFPGIQNIKQKADEYLSAAKKKAPIAKLQAQIDELMAKLDDLAATNLVLQEELSKRKPKKSED